MTLPDSVKTVRMWCGDRFLGEVSREVYEDSPYFGDLIWPALAQALDVALADEPQPEPKSGSDPLQPVPPRPEPRPDPAKRKTKT